jgi:hypothetical protein
MIDRRVLAQLAAPSRLYTRSEVLTKPPSVPTAPGLYAWYFREVPRGVPTASCPSHNGFTLLYIGISPSAPLKGGARTSKQTLRSRLRQHMSGNASGSTLRLTLGCLLAERLGLSLRPEGKSARLTFGKAGEETLSAWLDANARVAWAEHPNPWTQEAALIKELSPPLNLDHNAANPFGATLREVRRACRAKARAKTA